jgi:2-methylcitrate dehydratase PrpD
MSDVLTHTEEAASWGAAFRIDDAPREVVMLSRLQVVNTLAAIMAGARSAAGRAAFTSARSFSTSGPCILIPHGTSASLWDALFLHAVYSNALELDDFHYHGHLAPATVGVPLALGAALGASSNDQLRAQIVANELGGRLGWAMTTDIRHGHLQSYLVRFASAAAASVLLGLEKRRFAMALAVAMTQPELTLHRGMFSPDTKVLSAASSVVEGVRAALLARAGIQAALDILEHPSGFCRQFMRPAKRTFHSPFIQFGDVWCTHALSFKRFSACGYASGCVEAAVKVRRSRAFDPEDVRSIEVGATLPALMMERLATPHEDGRLTPVNVQFSILRSVCAALIVGDLRGSTFRHDRFPLLAQPISSLEAKSRLFHEWRYTVQLLRGLDAALPDESQGRWADMFQYQRTSWEMRKVLGTRGGIGPGDLARLARLAPEDLRFFVERWWRSLRSRLGGRRWSGRPLADLRRLSQRMGGRVTVTLVDGTTVSAEQVSPSGLAGDPDPAAMLREKLTAEADGLLDSTRCEKLWLAVFSDDPSGRLVSRLACTESGDEL